MQKSENSGIAQLSIGGILFISTLILSEFFSQLIPYGDYIFMGIALFSLFLLFIGMKKSIGHTIKNRE